MWSYNHHVLHYQYVIKLLLGLVCLLEDSHAKVDLPLVFFVVLENYFHFKVKYGMIKVVKFEKSWFGECNKESSNSYSRS